MNRHLLNSDIAEIVKRLGDEVKAFSGRTVLLTGGRGFLGRYFMEVFGILNRNEFRSVSKFCVTLLYNDNNVLYIDTYSHSIVPGGLEVTS